MFWRNNVRNQGELFDSAAVNDLQALLAAGCEPTDIDRGVGLLQQLRAASSEHALRVDRMLLEALGRMRAGLESARAAQEAVRQTIEELTAPPYFPAVFLARTGPGMADNALVRLGGELRAVSFGETDPDEFQPGDEVLLAHQRNVIVGKTLLPFTCGETAQFVRYSGEGRLVTRSRDEESVLLAAAALRGVELKAGDLLRFDRNNWVAYEKIDRPNGDEYFLEETPGETFDGIGGLDHQIQALKEPIELRLLHPEILDAYRTKPRKSVLLYGSPGTGKTMVARALANWMAGLAKTGRSRFINVKPGGLHSMWFGQSEANYREVFRVAREAGSSEPETPVVIFFDEADSIAGVRGQSVNHIDDKVANSFMAELSGLQDSGNILVVTATNRLDAMDPAMTRAGRLGDLMLHIPRPGRKAARQIFEKHLPAGIPWASNGHGPEQARNDAIDTAVAMIFSANGDGDLAHVMFRDGKRRAVRASDLINGAEIASIARSATERAIVREARGGESGIGEADVVSAVTDFLRSAARVLAPHNCRNYLDDMPQDVDVVRVEPAARKVSRPYRYINAA
jgi:proteasome-associated ATPase